MAGGRESSDGFLLAFVLALLAGVCRWKKRECAGSSVSGCCW